jgi:signal transduction histidine kinase
MGLVKIQVTSILPSMMLFKRFFILIFLMAIRPANAKELPASIFVYVDSLGQHTIEELLQNPRYFKSSQSQSPNLGFSKATLWVKVKLPKHDEPIIVTIENAHIDFLSCYIYNGQNQVRTFITGDLKSFLSRDINSNLFSFVSHPGEDILYFRASGEGSLAMPLRIHTLKEYFVYDRLNQIVVWIFVGIALVSLSANLIFFVTLKDKTYLYYSVYVLGNLFYACTDLELSNQYLWPNFPAINKLNLLFYSTPILTLIFCNYFLELRKIKPLLFKINVFFMSLEMVSIVYSLIDYQTSALLSATLFFCIPLSIFISSTVVYIQTRNRIVLFFLFSWMFYIIGTVVYVGATLGWFSYFAFLSNIILLASSLEMVLVFVIVMFKINVIREENIYAKNKIISLLVENEKALGEQKNLLEMKVVARTKDLQVKNEELFSQRELLEVQNNTISETIRELTEYKTNLEEIVRSRTHELNEANIDLDQKNIQLEQFAFMAAHNLRSPVATIIGLSMLMEVDTSYEVQREVVKRIHDTVKNLDVVVKSLTSILSDPKVEFKLFEECDLSRILEETKRTLASEIASSKAQIVEDLHFPAKISSIKAYLHNLFYHLLSNSIKYSAPNKNPYIEIVSRREGNDVEISFRDNGMGINMSHPNNELFTPYKRFANPLEEKGIGMYLVQFQVKAMGGKIHTESILGEGTSFVISLPNAALHSEINETLK